MSNASEEKELGSQAFKAKNYQQAIIHWTSAIKLSAGEKETLKVLHANRSAAYVSTKDFNAALLDANECIKVDNSWAKGFTRKAEALHSLRRFSEALEAYDSAIKLAPADESSLKKKRDEILRLISSSSSSSSQSVQPNNQLGNSPVQNWLRLAMFAGILGYMIPFIGIGINMTCYKVFLISAIVSFGMTLYRNHGVPRFNKDYLQRLLLADNTTIMYLMMCCLLLALRPYLLAAAPMLLIEGFLLVHVYGDQIKSNPAIVSKVLPMIEQQMPQVIPNWHRMSEAQRWAFAGDQVQFLAATCEIWQGLFFVIEMLLPTRSMLATVIWWQFLQMRCMLSTQAPRSHIKEAFSMLDQQITSLVNHQYCPGLVRKGYESLRSILKKRVEPPSRGQEAPSMASSMMSRCSIM